MNENNVQNNNPSANNNPISNLHPMNNTSQPSTTPSASQPVTASNAPQSVSTSNAPQPVTTSNAPQPVTTSNVPQPVTTSNAPQPVTTSNAPQPSTTSNASQPSTTSNASQPSTTSNSSQPQELNLVNPLNPDEVIKKEILVKKEVTNVTKDSNEDLKNNEVNQNNNKLNPILLVLLVAIIVVLIIILYFTFFNKSDSTPTPTTPNTPDVPETPVTSQITLTDIVNNFSNHSNLQNLKILGYDCIAKAENDAIVVDVTEIIGETQTSEIETPNTKQYIFQLTNRNFTFSLNSNDGIYYILYLTLIDSIGMAHGLEENEIISLLTSIDLTVTNINGITTSQTENGTEITVNIDTKIDTSSLNTMYIEVSDLEEYRDFIEGSGTAQLEKGNLLFYKESDFDTTTILIGEKDASTKLTYNSILSVVELLYPNDLENFKTSYPSLENISFDRYIITLNPILTGSLENLYKQYENDYKFVLIQINRNF